MSEVVLLSEVIHREREALGGRTSGDFFVHAILAMVDGAESKVIIEDNGWQMIKSDEGDGILIKKEGKKINPATLKYINSHPLMRARQIHGKENSEGVCFTWRRTLKH